MHGLTDTECTQKDSHVPVLNLDGITHYFGKWSRSAFDIGITTKNALNVIRDPYNKHHKYTVNVFK